MGNEHLLAEWERQNGKLRSKWFSHDGWFEYGYDSHPGLFRMSADDKYEFRFNRQLRRDLTTLKGEGMSAARLIADKAGTTPVTLLLSGGLDSHFMVECFLAAEIPFTCLLIRHADGVNVHELTAALSFAKARDLKYRFVDLDMKELMTSGWARRNARLSQCWHLGYAPWCYAIEQTRDVDEVLVSGFNEPEVCWKPDFGQQFRNEGFHRGEWVWHDHERFPSFQKYLTLSERDRVVPSFYQYTMELWSAHLTNPFTMRMVRGAYNRRVFSSDFLKHLAYELPQRVKYTGYERVLTQLFAGSEAMRQSSPFQCGTSLNIRFAEVLAQIGL